MSERNDMTGAQMRAMQAAKIAANSARNSMDLEKDDQRLSDLTVFSAVLLAILQEFCDEMGDILAKYQNLRHDTKYTLNNATRAYDRFWVCVREQVIKSTKEKFDQTFTADYEAIKAMVEEYIEADPWDTNVGRIVAPQHVWISDFGSSDGIVKGTKHSGGAYSVKYKKCE